MLSEMRCASLRSVTQHLPRLSRDTASKKSQLDMRKKISEWPQTTVEMWWGLHPWRCGELSWARCWAGWLRRWLHVQQTAGSFPAAACSNSMTKLHKHIAGEEDSLAEDCSTPFRSNFSLNRFEMFADHGVSGAATGVKPESFRSALACPVS